jgi:tight adherence protein B
MTSVRRGVRAVAVAGAALAVLVVLAPPSSGAPAQAGGSGRLVQLVEVNSTDPAKVQVVFRYDGPASDTSKLTLRENGKTTQAGSAAPITDAKRDRGVVIVQDTSASSDISGLLAEGRSAVKALVAALPKDTQVAVVAAGSDVLLAQRFTTDPTLVEKEMGKLTPVGDGALWEGVARAANELKSQPNMVGTIVLITDGNSGKGVSFSTAKGLVVDSGATVFGGGVSGKIGNEPQELASATGGSFTVTDKVSDVTGIVTGYAPKVSGLYALTYSAVDTKGVSDLELTVGDVTTKGSYIVGSDARGAAAVAFQPPVTASGVKGLQNDLGKYLAIVLGLIGAALAAYAIIGIAVKDQSGLASVLQPYSEGYVARTGGDDDDEDDDSGMAQTAVMQRAVEFTRQFAERQGFLSRVEGALERANLPLRAAEAMFFYAAGAVVVALLTAVITRSPFVVLIVVGVTVLVPPALLNFLSNRRKRQFESMLPDTLQLLSGTLRAGYSMMQGVEAVSQEVSEPMGRELRRVVTEARLGRPLEESLDAVAERMDSPDFGWAVMAIRIQREVGGNLSELLMTVADTMTQRERLKRDVKSLTAEGRISAYVLAALPVLLGFAMYALNPDYMSALFDETIGKLALGMGVVMMIAGFMWMQAIVKIDV